ncbi:neurotrophin 1-like isoform X2 [Panulirus ornatus]|uniref:neurotrophin 1-like isoform X2 n=1 Tax=Panulirus ornatus TaxID=150431 RepID=UPI003A8914E5
MVRVVVQMILLVAWGVAIHGDPQDRTEDTTHTQPAKIDLDQEETGEDQVKKAVGAIPGPVGVSLGVPIPAPPLPVSDVVHASLRPGLVRVSRPACGATGTYCSYNQNYPLDKVNSIIDRFYNDVRIIYSDLYRFPTHDLVYFDNATLEYRRDGHFVCESSVDYMRPGWAQNLRGEWLAILNTDKFPQTIRVEKCRYEGKRCEYLPPCYKSKCVQRYSYVRLLCVDPYHPTLRPVVEVFRIPSACSCFVQDFTYY